MDTNATMHHADALREKVLREQVRIAFGHQPMVLVAAVAIAVIMAYVYRGHVPAFHALGWLTLVLAVSSLRAWRYIRFRRVSAGDFPAKRWRNDYLVALAASAVGWGTSAIALFPADPIELKLLLAVVVAGMTSAVVASHSSLMAAPLIWVGGSVLPLVVRFFLMGETMGTVMAALTLLFSVAMSVYSYHVYRMVKSSIVLRFENLDLVRDLRAAEGNFRKVLDFAPDPIIVHRDEQVIYANKATAEASGVGSPDDLVGTSLAVHADSKADSDARLARIKRGEILPLAIHKYFRADGSTIDVEVASTLIAFGGNPAIITIGRDVTQRLREAEELRRAKEQAEEAMLLKEKYLSLVSHDLRSPIGSVKGLVNLAREGTGASLAPRQEEALRRAMVNCDAMLKTIDTLLHSGRVKEGILQINREFADGRNVVEAAVAGLMYIADEKGVTVKNEVPAGYRIRVDKDLFQQVVQNLVSNAIKFSHPGGAVTVFIPEGRSNAIAVRDSGVGIKQGMRENLFRHDVRTSTVGTAGEKGSGLGLPMCHDIMKAHGGDLTVDSEPGQGSVFYASIPDARPLVLVVDDDDAMRYILRQELAVLDMEVAEAENGRAALSALERIFPDLIVTDLSMPEMDGIALITHTRANDRTMTIPIVVYSSGGQDERRKAMQMGANDFVHKSRSHQELMPRITRFFG